MTDKHHTRLPARPWRRLVQAAGLALAAAWAATAQAQIELKLGGHAGAQAVSSAAASSVTTPRVSVELMALAPQGVAPGQPLWLGLQITHQPGWHTYWKNPGDSGLPTRLDWQLPAGLQAGEIQWPAPEKIRIGQLTNLGYEGQVLLPVSVTVGPDWRAGAASVPVHLQASWLVCRQECIPEQAELSLDLPVGSSTAANAQAFEAARAAAPVPLPGTAQAHVAGDRLEVRVTGLPAAWRGQPLSLLPETGEVLSLASDDQARWDGADWTARIPLSAERSSSPERLPVLLALQKPQTGTPRAWHADLAITGGWPAGRAAAPGALSPALSAALQANQAQTIAPAAPQNPPTGLGLALLGALLGGLILNLMPCVFPVLAIKLLSFSRHSGHDGAARLRGQGLAYSAGVLLSFLALGALMLSLRAGGDQLGWGFQLQSPAVVAALAALFTLIGLNLAGVFELGHWLPGNLASTRLRHPLADSALSGVLAVAIASPCTAPFMGASLGLTLTLPAVQALAVFGALGLGMALPYLAVSLLPGLSHWICSHLPRPGGWMVVFRQLMAFPMFATVAWLVWVLGQQTGVDGAGALLLLLVLLAGLCWAVNLRGRVRGILAGVFVAALAWALVAIGPQLTRLAEPAAAASGPAEALAWEPWSPQRVQALVTEGRPVFVDFTAAWCVTCQVNKRTTLADPALLADLSARHVALLRADWTRQDPGITAALKALGRNGVPVYVAYRPGQAPVVLSELLSVADVRRALAL
ncbi:MAG: thioredoxin family protein [Curvibacter sp.]|nr:thioredoxin family protein [Curvibacter sp.]